MLIHLITVGTRLPVWVNTGFKDYEKRLTFECKLNLIAIPASKRTKNTVITELLREEEKKILAAIPKQSRVIALDIQGHAWTTQELAKNLHHWLLERRDISLLIGGPDGLSPTCLNIAEHLWSLSTLTLPHGLTRILVAEQLYRAHSLLKGHPYHRE